MVSQVALLALMKPIVQATIRIIMTHKIMSLMASYLVNKGVDLFIIMYYICTIKWFKQVKMNNNSVKTRHYEKGNEYYSK